MASFSIHKLSDERTRQRMASTFLAIRKMNQYPEYLRLHIADDNSSLAPIFAVSQTKSVAQQLTTATGWEFDFVETKSSFKNRTNEKSGSARHSQGQFQIVDMAADLPAQERLHRNRADEIANATNSIVQQLDEAHQNIRELNAELATHVPVIVKPQSDALKCIEPLLRSAAGVVGANRAALYTLDDATTCLNMRAEIGLGKLDSTSRELEKSTADLEALVGYAVVIEDTHQQSFWKVPADCAAAVCVPVSSMDTPLGTLWIFLDEQSECTNAQTNSIEIIAGRIASELQLHAIKKQVLNLKKKAVGKRELDTLQRRTPGISPPLEHLQIDSLKPQLDDSKAIVADWSFNEAGEMVLFSATIEGANSEAASIAAAAQAAFCALRNRVNSVAEMVSELAEVLCRLEPEIVHGELTIAKIDCDHCTIDSATISGALHTGDEDDFVVTTQTGLGQIGLSAWIGDAWKITRR